MVHTTQELEPGYMVKTQANDIVEVFSVRHFNDTVSVGTTRSHPILISIDEVKEIVKR
jgi:hypothetical protein